MTGVMVLEVPCPGGMVGSRQKGSHVNSSSFTLRVDVTYPAINVYEDLKNFIALTRQTYCQIR